MSAPENTQPPDPRGLHGPTTQAVGALERAVDVLKNQHDAIDRSNTELRADVRDMRDRLARLEVKVDNLPTKDWIGGVVNKAIATTATIVGVIATILGGIVALIHYSH